MLPIQRFPEFIRSFHLHSSAFHVFTLHRFHSGGQPNTTAHICLRESYDFFFCLHLYYTVHRCECVPTQTAGWSARLNVTLIKTFVLSGSERRPLEHEAHFLSGCQRGNDSQHMSHSIKEQKETVFAGERHSILWLIWYHIKRHLFFKGWCFSLPFPQQMWHVNVNPLIHLLTQSDCSHMGHQTRESLVM